MSSAALSLTARTLYAELQELALAIGATENLGEAPGTVVQKAVRGNNYLYYQYRDLSGNTKQAYLGADSEGTRDLVRRLRERMKYRAQDVQRLTELRAAFIGAGGFAAQHAPVRVLRAFADAGILRPGPGSAVLVGTHAFNALGNVLGVRWSSQMQTHDIDIAGEQDIDIAVAAVHQSVPDVLTQLEMGFIPVPTLDRRSPSTSFRIRGQDLRVDLLTPLVGKQKDQPVMVAALNAPAQPVRLLDYLLHDVVPCVILSRTSLVLANVPLPERFALHKLLVSESRPAAFANKSGKDRLQAMQLLEVLISEAPDGIGAAKADLVERGKGWTSKLNRALKKAEAMAPDVAEHVATL